MISIAHIAPPPSVDSDSPAPDLALPPLPPLPPLLLALLGRWFPALLHWLGALLTQRILRAAPRHPLLLLHALLDLTPTVAACAAYRAESGPGRPATFPLDLLLRAEILRVWYGNRSDRQLEDLLSTDLRARWFVGLDPFALAPDHSTLSRFHAWFNDQAAASLFYDSLAQIDHHDPEPPGSTEVVDTFALRSPAATTSAARILLHLCGDLLADWRDLAPSHLAMLLAPVNIGWWHHPWATWTPEHRAQLVQDAVNAATLLRDTLIPAVAQLDPAFRAHITAQWAWIEKVIADEFAIDPVTGCATERPNKDKGAYGLGSAEDPEATFRKHDAHSDFGANAAISATATRIRAAVVKTGSTPDASLFVAVVQQEVDAGLVPPTHLVGDQAGGLGKTRAQVSTASNGQTTMVAKVPPVAGVSPDRFGPDQFRMDPDTGCLRCPHGQTSSAGRRKPNSDGLEFDFVASKCAGCPFVAQCRDPKANARVPRRVTWSDYRGHQAAAAAFNATDAGTALLGVRYRIEPVVRWLTGYEGCREARRVGLAAAQGLLFVACAVRNLKRWIARIRRGTAAMPPEKTASAPPLSAPPTGESA